MAAARSATPFSGLRVKIRISVEIDREDSGADSQCAQASKGVNLK
jgi:hypothetical protein